MNTWFWKLTFSPVYHMNIFLLLWPIPLPGWGVMFCANLTVHCMEIIAYWFDKLRRNIYKTFSMGNFKTNCGPPWHCWSWFGHGRVLNIKRHFQLFWSSGFWKCFKHQTLVQIFTLISPWKKHSPSFEDILILILQRHFLTK